MTLNLKIFLLIVEVIFFVMIIYNIRRNKLLLKYSLLWLISAFIMTIVIIFPKILKYICMFLGIELISNLVFLLGLFILLMLTFALTIIVSGQNHRIILLVEEIRNIT